MYIRRKVFSRFIDDNGDERLFSTTDYEYERDYSWQDESGNLHYENSGRIVGKEELEKAEDIFNGKKGPKNYKGGTPGGKPASRTRPAYTEEEMKKLKGKVGKRTAEMKGWNKTDSYKKQRYEASRSNIDLKERLSENRDLKNKLGRAKAMNKGLLIGLGATTAGVAGYGAYRAIKAKKAAKKEEEKD